MLVRAVFSVDLDQGFIETPELVRLQDYFFVAKKEDPAPSLKRLRVSFWRKTKRTS